MRVDSGRIGETQICMKSSPSASASNGTHPAQALVGDDGHLPEIGARIERPAEDLLRAHVRGRPHDEALLRLEVRLARRAEHLGHAEVEHLDRLDALVARQKDVRRLEIAVDDPRRVGARHAARSLPDDVRNLRGEQRPAPGDALFQALPFEQLHRHEGDGPVDPVIEDLHHVRALELGGGARLLVEAREQLGRVRSTAHVDELHGHDAPERHVLGAPHLAHRARAELAEQLVAAAEENPCVPHPAAGRQALARNGHDGAHRPLRYGPGGPVASVHLRSRAAHGGLPWAIQLSRIWISPGVRAG
ncbi:MAG: hypothetical protein U0359_40425 [Byssovorax sp.]